MKARYLLTKILLLTPQDSLALKLQRNDSRFSQQEEQ